MLLQKTMTLNASTSPSCPPQQVIDICLTLDIHVPVALKRNIWPTDFKTVIASMQNLVPKLEETATSIPPVNGTSNPQGTTDKSPQASTEPKPPDKQPTAGPSKPPLQPYGFSTQPAYPHTPYYQALPPGFTPYSYPTYPPPHGAYLSHQPFPPSAYAAGHALFQETTLPPTATEDTDLPSYEDMIVEGLIAVDDPNGMAPKDLFNWMAARYPVQSNFRPSASQALQKAFRRGRFQKSSDGKYRLNPNWEGVLNTTRNPPTADAERHSGRTESSRGRSRRFLQQRPPSPLASHPPSPLPHATATPAAAVAPALARPTPAATPKPAAPPPPATVPAPKPAVPPTTATAYAAAQTILQNINFGGVFKFEDEARRGEVKVKMESEAVGMSLAEHARAELQAQLALLAAQLEEIAQQEGEEDEDEEMEEVK
ncbi:H15 domain-containing protein [Mycena venus]|uniref:Histone H1 n=1 Tax=Mycena venus TaxID=2733690 RepID=A0A8H6YUV3_9AGAR|nr:H15 domain-containing protein [Mycena venus]